MCSLFDYIARLVRIHHICYKIKKSLDNLFTITRCKTEKGRLFCCIFKFNLKLYKLVTVIYSDFLQDST